MFNQNPQEKRAGARRIRQMFGNELARPASGSVAGSRGDARQRSAGPAARRPPGVDMTVKCDNPGSPPPPRAGFNGSSNRGAPGQDSPGTLAAIYWGPGLPGSLTPGAWTGPRPSGCRASCSCVEPHLHPLQTAGWYCRVWSTKPRREWFRRSLAVGGGQLSQNASSFWLVTASLQRDEFEFWCKGSRGPVCRSSLSCLCFLLC